MIKLTSKPKKWRYVLPIIYFIMAMSPTYANRLVPRRSLSVQDLERKVRMDFQNVTLNETLNHLQQRYNIPFAYASDIIPSTPQVTFRGNTKIKLFLQQTLDKFNLSYDVKDGFVVVKPKKRTQQKQETPSQVDVQDFITVRGAIKDVDGNPLPAVSIQLKGDLSKGTKSDESGNFVLEDIPSEGILVFSYVGFRPQEMALEGKALLQVIMTEDSAILDEVVVVGYGTQKKSELTSAVASVKSEDFLKGVVIDAGQLLSGKVAGLGIVRPDGDPNSTSQINLRGVSTILSDTQPLVLIDGIPGNLNLVAPEDIESIDVLKDGSAAAIYGTRGTNGVILVSTRKASGDVPTTIDINSYAFTQRIARRLPFMTADQYREKAADFPGFVDHGYNTDWLEEVTQRPLSSVNNVTLMGGKKETNYIANVNYRSMHGIMQQSDNKVLAYRFQVNHNMFDDKLQISANLLGNDRRRFSGGDGENYRGIVYRNALIYNPTDRTRSDDGTWVEHPGMHEYNNPLALVGETRGLNQQAELRAFGTIAYRPVQPLTLKALISRNIDNEVRGYSETQQHISTIRDGRNGYASRGTSKDVNDLLELTAQYDKSFSEHNINILGGYGWQQDRWEDYWMQNWDFPTDQFSYNNMGAGQALRRGEAPINSNQNLSRLVSYFARVNYNYKGKYLFMASLRHEGSTKFGTDHKWGNFPAVSGGWNIKGEPFLASSNLITQLKLRSGFGITGTIPTNPYESLSRLRFDENYYVDGEWIPILTPANNPNPDLRWERKEEFNFGLDYGLLKDRLSGSVDFYHRTTRDLLWEYRVSSPPYLYNVLFANAGSMRNLGLEIQVNGVIVQRQHFSWRSTINYSTNKNTLLSLSNDEFQVIGGFQDVGGTGEPIQQPTHRIEDGGAIGNFWGYKAVDIDEQGRWIIEGANGEHKPIADQQPDDKRVIGNGLPRHLLAWNHTLNYKMFDLAIVMRGAFKYQILNGPRMFYESPVSLTRGNLLNSAFDQVFGKRQLSQQQELQYLDYYIEDGDFWKIDNVTLGYTFKPANSVIRNLRVYVSGTNLVTISGYSGIDPELNILGLTPGVDPRDRYPSTRSYTFGVQATF